MSLPPRVYLVHTCVGHERSYRHKSFAPLCLWKKKEKKILYAILEKTKLWRQKDQCQEFEGSEREMNTYIQKFL